MTTKIVFNPITANFDLVDKADTIRFSRVASINLSGHRVVTAQVLDGKLVYADWATSLDVSKPLWLTLGSITANTSGIVHAYGRLDEPSWTWTDTSPIWLGSNGDLTQILPTTSAGATFLLQVATVITPTSIFFDPQSPIKVV